MKFGVYLYSPGGSGDPSDVVRLAQGAEKLEFDSVWIGDHIAWPAVFDPAPHDHNLGGQAPPPGVVNSPIFEPLTTLAFLAATVDRIRLGIGVLVAPYRHPILTAKMLAMLDLLSGGRLIIGIGAGWLREEFVMLGASDYDERGHVTDEYLQAFIELWTKAHPHFDGKFAHVTDVVFNPKPIQQPHPPIWIGGNGVPAMKRAAAYGQGWMPLHQSPAQMAEKIPQMKAIAAAAGRDPDAIRVAVGCGFHFSNEDASSDGDALIGNAAAMVEKLLRYQEAGVSEVRLLNHGYATVEDLVSGWERLANEVAPQLA